MRVGKDLFLPVHGWAVATSDLPRLAAMGVNVAYLSGDGDMTWSDVSDKSLGELKTFLDECAKNKMYGILSVEAWFRNPARRGTMKDKTLADFMARFKDHPALLGWHISLEEDMGRGRRGTDANGAPAWQPTTQGTTDNIEQRYREVKKADASHPVLVMYSGGQMLAADRKFNWTLPTPESWYLETSKHCDILYLDLFPVANNTADDIKQIADATDLLAKYGQGKKHLWVAVDAGDRKRWTTKSHAPTADEIRCELWQAIVHGAHGLGFDFTGFNPYQSIRMDPNAEKGLAASLQQIQELKEPILLGRTEKTVTAKSSGDAKVDATLREWKGKTYVFAVNVLVKPGRAEITLPSTKADKAKVLGEDRTVPIAAGRIEDAFDARAVHLYEIEP